MKYPSGSEPFFSSARHTPRERSATDVVALVASMASLAVLSLVSVPASGFEQAVIALIEAVPSWADIVWRLGAVGLLAWVVTVLYVAAVRRRSDVLVDAVLTSASALGAAALLGQRINGSWPDLSEMLTGGATGTVPLVLLSTGAAVAFSAAPHLSRPFRRVDRAAVYLGGLCAVMLSATTPVGAVISLLVGAASAAAVHLVLGASAGRPTVAAVAASLAELGVSTHELTLAGRQAGGVVALDAIDDRGDPLRVKVYGRDARDAQLLERTWRGLWYRGAAPAATGRLQEVEHEALVTMFASARGVHVPSVVVAGSDARRDAVLVLRDRSGPLAERPMSELRAAISGVWGVIEQLHAAGMTHGDLSADSFGVVDEEIVLRDLSSATLGGADSLRQNDLRQKDLAQTLVTTAALVGIERAVVAAVDEIGSDRIADMLAYLQAPALGTALRRQLKAAEFDLDALRSAAAGAAGVEVPEVVELRRVRPQSLVTIALVALVAFALITSLGNVDLAELLDELTGAAPGWLFAALIVGQTPFVSQAIATRGACPRPVPLGPLALLQSGVAFVALAVPSTAGRLALDIRFFQRQGLAATSAVSIAAVDGFSGFLVQISLLLLTLGFGVGAVEMDFSGSGSRGSGDGAGNLALILGVLAVAVVIAIVVALSLPRVRRQIADRLRPMVAQASDTVRSLRSPIKLLELFGGNLLNQFLFAITLGLCLRAFGGDLNLGTLLVVYVAAALFGGMMPVPGGVGVMEAALTAGLMAAGVDPTPATATALLFRLITFYLPPLWGWLSLRWLRRHEYL